MIICTDFQILILIIVLTINAHQANGVGNLLYTCTVHLLQIN